MSSIAAVAGVSLVASIIGTRLLFKSRARDWLLDRPNARSLHVRSTPRSGGVAVLLSCVAALLVIGAQFPVLLLLGVVLGAV